VIEIAARFAMLIWVATSVYVMPFAGTVGVATFLALLKAKHRLLSVGAGTVVTVLSAWMAYPTVEKCTTSISARQSLLETLTPQEAATLRSPPTLSDPNDFCPTYFEYRTSSGWVEASAVFDLASGIQIFKRDRQGSSIGSLCFRASPTGVADLSREGVRLREFGS
jgi:hypothetical protein